MSMDNKGSECCGNKLTEIIPGTVDASKEKHIPQYEIKENKVEVCVGAVIHPMTEEHYIAWVCLQTTTGCQVKYLSPTDEPKACFMLSEGEDVRAVYAYCNLHGLWKI